KHRRPSSASTAAQNSSTSCPSCSARARAWGSPAAVNMRFIAILSMPIAEPSTPAPTYGRPASSSSPCTVPSSPYGPCINGMTTSTASSPRHRIAAHLERGRERIAVAGGEHVLSVRREQPPAFGRDADRHDLVLVGVQCPGDGDGGDPRHVVFSRLPAEQQHDTQTIAVVVA